MVNLQRRRLLTQGGFFILFVLAPVFDLFRLDLDLGHFFFLGMNWTLGFEDVLAKRISGTQFGINIMVRAGLPILSVIAAGVWLSWKFGRLYCGWLCPHFSVVETINRVMRRAIGKHSLWDRHPSPTQNPDGSAVPPNPWYWLVLVPLVLAFSLVWAVALLTYLLPPAEIYANLRHATLTRNQGVFLGVATSLLFIEFLFARHLFCRYGCAVGYFQSLAWMGNRKALIVGFDRRRAESCAGCDSACEHACPMRLKPRTIKRHMFTCTQCHQCADACTQVQKDNPQGTLLKWVQRECALDKSARDFGHHIEIAEHCFAPKKSPEKR